MENISFGYKSPVKKIAQHCVCTGKAFIESNRATLEHILPQSKGGRNGIDNCLATLARPNQQRGDMVFDKWLKKKPKTAKHVQDYLIELRGATIKGRDCVESVKNFEQRSKRHCYFHRK